MVDFIYMVLLDLLRVQTDNYKIKNSCPQWDTYPGPSAYEAKSLSVALLDQIHVSDDLSWVFLTVLLFDELRRLLTVKSL